MTDNNQTNAGDNSGDNNQDGGTPLKFQEWINDQPENIQLAYRDDIAGLKNALTAERDSVKGLKGELELLDNKLKNHPELEQVRTDLNRINKSLESTERQRDFYEVAAASGVTNFNLAWLAISNNWDDYHRRGKFDVEAFKTDYPELFLPDKTRQNINAGDGSGDRAPKKQMTAVGRAILESRGK